MAIDWEHFGVEASQTDPCLWLAQLQSLKSVTWVWGMLPVSYWSAHPAKRWSVVRVKGQAANSPLRQFISDQILPITFPFSVTVWPQLDRTTEPPKGCNWSLNKDTFQGVPAQECAQETNLGNPALCFRKWILYQLVEITLAAQKWEGEKFHKTSQPQGFVLILTWADLPALIIFYCYRISKVEIWRLVKSLKELLPGYGCSASSFFYEGFNWHFALI